MVACASGTSNFCTVASDSPSSPRSFDAASPSVSSTFSLDAAVTCSSASVSPLWQFTAFNPSTYSLPRLANRSGNVSFAARPLAKLAGHFGREFRVRRTGHQFQGLRHFAVGEHIQKGDCRRETLSAVFSVSSNTGIARAVGEIGENDGVFLGEHVRLRPARKVKPRHGQPTITTAMHRRNLPTRVEP